MKKALIVLACLASTNVCAFADETSVSNTTTKTDAAPAASVSSTEVKSKHHGNKVKSTTTSVNAGASPVSSTTSTTDTKVSH
jgi:hypothetical protein